MSRKDSLKGRGSAARPRRRLAMILGGVCVLAVCAGIRYYWPADPASAQPQPAPAGADAGPARPNPQGNSAPQRIVATVNGEQITREELARECLQHYGNEVLESLLNKYLIVEECQRLGILVTQEEVNREIERIAKRFNLPVDRWLEMLKQERGVSPAQYASDIIWPMLALRKLAGEQLQISREELLAEYESQYGPAIRARLIACQNADKAQQVRAQAVAQPAEFGNLAKQHSEDPTSASLKGMIQPIRKHSGNKQIEQIAFSLKDGEISPVLQIGDQYIILQREAEIPARQVPLQEVQPRLEELIRDRKLRSVATQIFQRLRQQARVVNLLKEPEKARLLPGVAGVVNNRQITMRELADRCIERHGQQVLEGTINRRLLEQACRQRNIPITEADLDREIARAAGTMLKPLPDGKPDVQTWIKMVTQQQGISEEVYRHDAVWPTVALKKLAGDRVQVTQEDLQKGYEANYGPRVRCRAIVLDDLRRAQRVWELAKQNPSREYFGQLAAEYSIEPGSRALKGEVPPIQKHGGQPELEKEAFSLKPGELSGIIPVENTFVILLCEGYTKPPEVDFAAVRDILFEDIQEKKLRLAMAEYFQHLQDEARIDNYLAGTSRAPKRTGSQPVGAAAGPSVSARPGWRK
ncbi:MAG: peptidylprolyl isomerase [Thermoguttaceae bacterium]